MIAGSALFAFDANAQSGNDDQNFKVCRTHDGYDACDKDKQVNYKYKTPEAQKDNIVTAEDKVQRDNETKACEVTYYMFIQSEKDNPRLRASYKVPGDVYEGDEVPSNDGVQANIQRNINYLDFSVTRPPNDGGLAMQE